MTIKNYQINEEFSFTQKLNRFNSSNNFEKTAESKPIATIKIDLTLRWFTIDNK